jgi:meiotically up-regulated gene 157 (Mug157) protein
VLATLVSASACTGLVHESFDRNSVFSYTRPWCVPPRLILGTVAAGGASIQGSRVLHSPRTSPPIQSCPRRFAWVNSLFADFVLKVADERPHLIFKQ